LSLLIFPQILLIFLSSVCSLKNSLHFVLRHKFDVYPSHRAVSLSHL
jgi:hypothetical protein